jgi:hypothetical protein
VGATIETEEQLKQELTKMGYSKRATKEILKWVNRPEN